jgi:outer membrane protein TolC
MTQRAPVLLAFAIGLMAGSGHAATPDTAKPGAGGLNDAAAILAQTYETNPSLAAAGAQLRVVDEQVASALGMQLPSVNVLGQAGEFSEQLVAWIGTDLPLYRESFTYRARLMEIDATQPLYHGGGIAALMETALADVAAQQATVASIEQQVLQAAGQADADVYAAQRVVVLQADEVAWLTQEVEADRAALARQDVTVADLATAEKRLGDAQAAHRQALAQLAQARHGFVAVVGRPPGPNLSDPALALRLPATQAEAVRRAIADSPDVLAPNFLLDAARADRTGAIAHLLPTVDLNALYHNENHAEAGIIALYRSNVAVDTALPIFPGGRVGARIAGADAGIDQRAAALQSARDAAAAQAVAAWQTWQAASLAMTSLRQAVVAAEQSLIGVKHERALGLRTVLEVLNAAQALVNARVTLLQSESTLFVAALGLQAAVGRLTARDLHLAVTLRDNAEHLAAMRTRWRDPSLKP